MDDARDIGAGKGAGHVQGLGSRELPPRQASAGVVTRVMVLALVLGVTGCRTAPKLMPTPNAYWQQPAGVFASVPASRQSNVVDLLYVTDREPVVTPKGRLGYTHRRAAAVAFGTCSVGLGSNVSWEELVQDSLTRKRSQVHRVRVQEVRELGRFPETPYPLVWSGGRARLAPEVARQDRFMAEVLRAELARRLAETARKEVVVFVHGFNNDFEDAATITAQLWHFFQREGLMVLYSWPAGGGGLRGYAYDRESGEFTVHHLKQFLRVLLDHPDVERVHLMAHSRGTDVLTSAIRELSLERRMWGGIATAPGPVANLILIAPDLDLEVAGQRIWAEHLAGAVGRLTVYVCREDRAITLSNWLFEGFRRLGVLAYGDLTPAQLGMLAANPNVQIVNVKGRAGFLSHGYFHSNPAASSDLLRLLREDCDAGTADCRPLIPEGEGFWRLDPDYPAAPR